MRVNTGSPSFPVNAALAPYLRVKKSAGYLVAAGSTDDELGTLEKRVLSTDTTAAVIPREESCVRYMVAKSSFSADTEVYAAADGKIDDTGTLIRGMALDASTGDGDVVRVLSYSASLTGDVPRAQLTQDDLQPYPILNESWYLFDSTIHAPLGATALSADDLIYTLGTLGTSEPKLTATDFGGTSATQKARIRLALPPEYVAGQTITLRVNGLTGTTLADTSSTVDFNVYRAAAPTVDICATAAQSINSLTAVDVNFTITPTDCVPGDVLDILLTYAGVDAGNLGVIAPAINSVTLLLDIKG